MAQEIDEAWVELAIERYQRLDALRAELQKAYAGVEVTVRSPDGLVAVAVSADGVIRDVTVADPIGGFTARELSGAVRCAVAAAADAAAWARAKLRQEAFRDYPPLEVR